MFSKGFCCLNDDAHVSLYTEPDSNDYHITFERAPLSPPSLLPFSGELIVNCLASGAGEPLMKNQGFLSHEL
jgi:hypothetical protein